MKPAIALLSLTAAVTAPGPHKVARNSPALEFSYEWPREAAAIPGLDLKLYKDAKNALRDAQRYAAEDQKLARDQKRDFNAHYSSTVWETVGQTARLLSLEGTFEQFTGGAHPNHDSKALLWERSLGREVALTDQFLRTNSFAALTRPAYCKKLEKERLKRREGEKLGGEFDECPKYAKLAIAPVDKNRNGRFDVIDFVASPYVAGPYVEGEYEVEIPVSRQLMAAMKPAYRGSYEPQRQ